MTSDAIAPSRHGLPRAPVSFWIGLAIVGGLLVASILAPYLPFVPGPLEVDYHARLAPPSFAHLLGTDNLGRDMLARVIHGARIDLFVGFTTVFVSMCIGITMGVIAAHYRGLAEVLIMRTVDALLAFPFIVLILAIVAIIGAGLTGVFIGMIVVGWTVYARITYSEMLALRERQFILAARTLGYRDSRIIFRHAIPNLLRPNIAFSMSDVILNILGLASLSYLGAGVKPPEPEWGALIAAGQDVLLTGWWVAVLPGIAVVIAGLGFSLLGEGLSDLLRSDGEDRS